MAHPDPRQEAVEQVEKTSDSESVRGEDSLESPELKRKRHEARKALRPDLPVTKPSGE